MRRSILVLLAALALGAPPPGLADESVQLAAWLQRGLTASTLEAVFEPT